MTGRTAWLRPTMTGVVVALALPAAGAGQAPTTCAVVFDSVGTFQQFDRADGTRVQRYWDGVWARCLGQTTRMRADSVEWFSIRQRVDFFRRVRFEDSTVVLDADRATYFLGDDRLEAYGNVRLENRGSGSVLEGPALVYRRQVVGIRDTADLAATGRPNVEYRSASEPPDAEPYIIVGNRVRLRGDDAAWASGAVTIDRSDFHAVGDSAELFLGAGRGQLLGHARIEGSDSSGFMIAGQDIGFTFRDSDLEWVQARGLAEAESEEWRLVADTLEFTVRDDAIQSGLAWGDSVRPQAVSVLHTISADSLAIDTPDQVLEEVRGFGGGRATSVRDSVDVESDWIAGDTVVARFGPVPSGRRTLIALSAAGQARSLYRIFDGQTEGPPPINYSRGDRILASFGEFGVVQVDVVGAADGVHLEPVGRRRRP